jgi:hypothetical protein
VINERDHQKFSLTFWFKTWELLQGNTFQSTPRGRLNTEASQIFSGAQCRCTDHLQDCDGSLVSDQITRNKQLPHSCAKITKLASE